MQRPMRARSTSPPSASCSHRSAEHTSELKSLTHAVCHHHVEKKNVDLARIDRKSTRLNSSHLGISYAAFCLKKKRSGPHGVACFAPDGAVRTHLTSIPRNQENALEVPARAARDYRLALHHHPRDTVHGLRVV